MKVHKIQTKLDDEAKINKYLEEKKRDLQIKEMKAVKCVTQKNGFKRVSVSEREREMR